MTKIYLDTETLGLAGLPFVIQTKVGIGPVQLFHVLEHSPQESLALVDSLCRPDVELVAFNATFDLRMLSKLATVAAMVGDAWTFDAVWAAERIWRAESSFTERLQHLRLAYPGRVVDLMIAAQSLPPLEEQFISPPAVFLPRFPVAVLPHLLQLVRSALDKRPYYSESSCGLEVAARLRATVADTTGKQERQRVERAQQGRDYTCLREVTFGIQPKEIYTLKNVARLLGFAGEIRPFEFLDEFGRIPETYAPTYPDRELYARLRDFVQRRQHDPAFLEYAARDVDMLVHLDAHYRSQPGFPALEHDFAIVPLVANLELYGVPLDPEKVRATIQYYRDRVAESAGFLQEAGLENFNSGPQVVRFINRLLRRHLREEDLDEIELVEDMQKDTLASLLAELKQHGHGPDGHVVQVIEQLVRARTFSRRPEFFKHVIGDTLYPHFHIRGTVTDRMTTSHPSIQNMPTRTTTEEQEDHVAFRAPFVPPAGYRMLVGDADQFEMRLVAAEAREQCLVEGFVKGDDPHSLTAVRALGHQMRTAQPTLASLDDTQLLELLKDKDERVKAYRGTGKTLNFATIYGSTEYGIARQSGKTPDEARAMLDAFFRAYPAIQAAIRETQETLRVLRDESSNGWGGISLVEPSATRIPNRLGVTRSFELALRLVQIFARLGDFEHLQQHLPEVVAIRTPIVQYYDSLKTPMQVVASQCRSAARRLQAYCQRQAFNFKIQSLGAGYIKQLQARLLRRFIPPGVHRAADLDVLPGINVHDEIHLLVKDAEPGVHDETRAFVEGVSADLNVPIRFEFVTVSSWADKA